jgi:hypothetical protein
VVSEERKVIVEHCSR